MSLIESERVIDVTAARVVPQPVVPEKKTRVVGYDATRPPAQKRRVSKVRPNDLLQLVGSALGAVAFTVVLFQFVAPFDGPIGFVVIAYVVFIALYSLVVFQDEDVTTVRDRLVQVVVTSLATVLLGALIYVVSYVMIKGITALVHQNFYTEDLSNAGPTDPLTQGGVLHAIAGSFIMITIALIIVIPLGIATAVYLNELPNRFSRFVRIVVEAMTALPSIIAGLFIYASLILLAGFEKSGLAAALAISVMMLPIIIRAADVVVRLVPGNLKEASYALGSSQLRTVWHVTLPTARSGLMTAIILGTARGIGETSPVLLTAGYTASLNVNPTSDPMVSLPLAAFTLIKNDAPNQQARGFGAAAVLLVLVLVLFIIARIIGGRGPGILSNRQRRRAAAQSRRDASRFERQNCSTGNSVSMPSPSVTSPDGHPEGGTSS
jgi:phosphate transport system permease protein